MPRGNAQAIALGPGYLYIAPLGTPEPADLTTPWTSVSAAWVALGYTDEGSEFSYEPDTDAVEVAEELDPVKIAMTGREMTVEFDLAEITATNLKRAMNGGTITTGAGVVTFEPPDLGTEVRTMLAFEAEDHTERWLFRQALQTGNVSIERRKGSDKSTISCEFMLEKPPGAAPFKAIMAAPVRA